MNYAQQMKALGLSPVRSMLGSLSELYNLPFDQVNAYKGSVIADNFRYHYENNAFYRDLCERKGVTPDDVQGFDDLIKIPMIPVRTFKEADSHHLMTAKLNQVEFEMRSTGTSGIPSVSRRESATMHRMFEGLVNSYREFFSISRGAGLFLFPPAEEMPEMGLVKALNIFAGMLDASVNLVRHVTFNPETAVEILKGWEGSHTRHIVGPPFLVHRLLKYCMDNDIKLQLDKKTFVITLGGWKRFTGQEIPRSEFNKLCGEYFGMNPDNVRDMYGLVEANMLAIECEQHEKHVPPWIHISMRNPKNVLEEVPYGERGVLAIYDPTITAYPGFILTEDVGYLQEHTHCDCGRNGQMVVYISRLPGVEVGCCAINLERFIVEKENKMLQETAIGGESRCITTSSANTL